MRLRVQCTWTVDVDLPDGTTEDEARFLIEENSCPGTGPVGAALYAAIKRGEAAGTCWACPSGTNRIIEERETP